MASQIGQKLPFPTLEGTTTMKPFAANSASLARAANLVPFSLVPLKPMKSGRGPVNEAGGQDEDELATLTGDDEVLVETGDGRALVVERRTGGERVGGERLGRDGRRVGCGRRGVGGGAGIGASGFR